VARPAGVSNGQQHRKCPRFLVSFMIFAAVGLLAHFAPTAVTLIGSLLTLVPNSGPP
jgi:hypothetical protein